MLFALTVSVDFTRSTFYDTDRLWKKDRCRFHTRSHFSHDTQTHRPICMTCCPPDGADFIGIRRCDTTAAVSVVANWIIDFPRKSRCLIFETLIILFPGPWCWIGDDPDLEPAWISWRTEVVETNVDKGLMPSICMTVYLIAVFPPVMMQGRGIFYEA